MEQLSSAKKENRKMATLNEKSAARLAYETNALMTKMVRSRQLRLDGKTSTPAYAKCIESIRKTKALCHKLRESIAARTLAAQFDAQFAKPANVQPKLSLEEIAAKVQTHALENYNKGWDTIVECYSTAEIVAELKEAKVRSVSGALKHFGETVSVRSDVARDHALEAASGQ